MKKSQNLPVKRLFAGEFFDQSAIFLLKGGYLQCLFLQPGFEVADRMFFFQEHLF